MPAGEGKSLTMLTLKCLGLQEWRQGPEMEKQTEFPHPQCKCDVGIFCLSTKMIVVKFHLNLQPYRAYSVFVTMTKPNPEAVTTCGAKGPL